LKRRGFDAQGIPRIRHEGQRRRAGCQHFPESDERLGLERLFGCRARSGDGRNDPAAGCGNLRVRRAGQPAPQLNAAIAGEHAVRARVDNPGHKRFAGAADDVSRWRDGDRGPDVGRRAGRNDGAAGVARHCAVGGGRDVTLARARARSETGDGVELIQMFDDERGGSHQRVSKLIN
jgi:hypothetical protein